MKTKNLSFNFKKSILTFSFIFLFSIFSINVFANPTPLSENDFRIMGTVQPGNNNIKLDWTDIKANYKLYQSIDGKEFETMSTFDLESGNDKVKVLQVYPDKGNNLKTWMETNGYGKGVIKVSEVAISTFNQNPNTYLFKDENGAWNYDVVVFGFWDRNNCRDLSLASRNVVEQFIEDGKGVIFGHDTVLCNSINSKDTYEYTGGPVKQGQGNFDYLASKYLPMKYGGTSYNVSDTKVTIAKKGVFTTYPWDLGEVGTTYTIPSTHSWGQYLLDTSNVWLTFGSDATISNQADFYIVTYNNVAQIQTGHSNGAATTDEQKLLANLLFYSDQVTEQTSYVDNSGQDFAIPNKPTIKIDANNNKLLLTATDNGTNYQYKAMAFLNGEEVYSEPINIENNSGVKGFYYIINNNPNEKITNATGNFSNGEIDLLSITSDTNYLHIATVDNANNVSETTSLNMDDIIGINASNIAYTINTTNDTTNVDLSIVASGVNVNYQWEMKTENGDWEEIDAATLDEHSMDITNMNELLYYRCRVYNNSLSMYSNEVIVNPTTYDKTYVYVTQASTFSVKIPKVMILSGNTGRGEYVVSVNGNVSGLASVNVTPNDFAIMKDVANIKTSFNAIVTQNKTLFNANEIIAGTTTNGLVDGSTHMTAGSWKGNFNFAIDFEDEKAKVNSIASINQNDDGTIVGYDKEQEQSTAYSHISFIN